jgi:protein-S-isoprenylcysteine O-methyltransferase Ste14
MLQVQGPALLVLAGVVATGVAFVHTAWRVGRRKVDGVGELPVPAPFFWLAKVAIAIPVIVLVHAAWRSLAAGPRPAASIAWASAAVFDGGALVAILAFARLGEDTRTGLPRESTRLRTGGIYAVSRNPMYLSILILHTAAVIWVPGLLTAVPLVVAAVIHDRIVRREERFLARRFGADYATYRARVRRYL